MSAAPKTAPVATRLTPDLVAKLDEMATLMGVSRADALRSLVEQAQIMPSLDPDAPLFQDSHPAPKGARKIRFAQTRYDRGGRKKR